MIRVERGGAPEFVRDGEFAAARERYEQFRAGGGSRTTQTYLDLDAALGRYLGPATTYAHELFHGKCAYTEVAASPHLHLHRPEVDAYDERLPSAPNHYWWTAFWYRNWYHATPEVASVKRNIFPVLGARAPEPPTAGFAEGEVPGEFLDRGVLLDPCEDHPQLHLVFAEDGRVEPWAERSAPWLAGEEGRRGPETIRVLDLNSRLLVGARQAALSALAGLGEPTPDGLGRLLLDPSTPHLGALRQVAAQRLLTADSATLRAAAPVLAPELVPHILANPGRVPDEVVAVVRESVADAVLAELLAAPVAHGADLPPAEPTRPAAPRAGSATITRTAVVTRIVVENFQAIDTCEIDVPAAVDTLREPDPVAPVAKVAKTAHAPAEPIVPPTVVASAARPWRVFLGENGSGKSSVLRAVALALAGDEVDALVERCGLRWEDLLRRGTTRGRVRVEFTGEDAIDLEFTADGPTEQSRAVLPRMEAYVRGFGATRLNSDEGAGRAAVRLGNLFDPLQPVVDAQAWLLDLESRSDTGDFNVAAVAIARLLGRRADVADTGDPDIPRFVRRVGDEIWVADEPLRLLSDGYRAIITLACDLMAGAGRGLSDMRNASGIVLIDELGCYLHPRWKMQITRTLRDVFPSMQFLVTTHEPLCLRGLVEHEVVRVTRSSTDLGAPWKAEFEVIEDSPSRYRVDRLLTSSFFGLDTTIDPEVDQEFQQYYALVRRAQHLTTDEDQTRRRLRARLSQHGILGYTARDQLVYDAIDRFLATSPTLDPEQRRAERRRTLDHVAEIWRTVAAQRETTPS